MNFNGIKAIAGVLMVIGVLTFAVGIYTNSQEIATAKAQHEIPSDHQNEELNASTHQEEEDHLAHTVTQLSNRPWTAIYIAAFMFLGIALASLFFLAIQHASSAGWSIILVRVMEGIASYLPIGGLVFFIILILSGLHFNHMFHWMDERLIYKFMIEGAEGQVQYLDQAVNGAVENPHFDKILANKSAYLNVPFWLIRSAIYLTLWTIFLFWIKKISLRLDNNPLNRKIFIKQRNIAAGFLVVFAVTSSMLSWDWIMSFDPHWYSTLFGWYTFTSYLTCAICTIILVSVYLKKKGYFPAFNDNHMHDLTKYMFGFSLLWTYLWFSQFMLIWYADIPEEVTYYNARFDEHKLAFLGMLIPNFILPFIVLVSSSIKRNTKVVVTMALVILLGHYIDFFVMTEPGSVGHFAGIGWLEIGSFLLFLGLFIFTIFMYLPKRKLEAKGNLLYHESEIYHYPF